MNFKRNIKKLLTFKKEIEKYSHLEQTDIKSILTWRNKRQKKIKTISKIINLNKCKGWYFDKNFNLYHKSGQFFKRRNRAEFR